MKEKLENAVKILKNVLCLLGLATTISAWIIIFISVQNNPWFRFTKHAFSDLGGPHATNSWIFNNGLIFTGTLALLYSFCLIMDSENKIECIGSAFMIIASIFLILIGIFPSGTKPHTFVSLWFFIQLDMTIISWGIGLLLRKWLKLGIFLTAMGILAPIIAMLVPWPSVAIAETYGIVIIDIWIILMLRIHFKKRIV